MIRIKETLAGDEIRLHCVESKSDLSEVVDFIRDHSWLGFDTESTGINCYKPGWKLRTAQWGNEWDSYVIPARWKRFIRWAIKQPIHLIGHNGPHDIRCIDKHLGEDSGVVCDGETYTVSHLADSRGQQDGGVGHGLKELGCAYIDPTADRFEKRLKLAFKQLLVAVPGETYKSGPRRGQPKFRKAKLAEGWELIDPFDPDYLAYAAVDPILTKRVWNHFQYVLRESAIEENDQLELYRFNKRLAWACDQLTRRAIQCDVPYTMDLSDAYQRKVERTQKLIRRRFGVDNVNSTAQIADCLIDLKVKLTKKTDTGKWSTKAEILRALVKASDTPAEAKKFIRLVLVTKQVSKRRTAYTEAMLREMDADGRVHPSINSQAARTDRMSVSGPPLQQLPVKDHESELDWDVDDEELITEMEEQLA